MLAVAERKKHKSPAKRPEDTQALVNRYLAGESVQDIAKDHGATRAAIYKWMLSGLGDKDYQDLVTYCLVKRVADADERLESADNAVDIARAREMARFARMDLERRRPALYGQTNKVQLEVMEDLGERLRRARSRTIDAESVVVEPQKDEKQA